MLSVELLREASSRGGQARAANMTPEQRQEAGRRAYLAGAARTVAARWDDVPVELQVEILAAALR